MAVKFQDYYEVLDVPRGASQDEIRKAYRKLARKYHPDVNKTKDAEERFKKIGEAYEVLGDSQKRKRYDTLGENWSAGQDFTPPPGWDFFGQQGAGGRSRAFHFQSFGDSPFEGKGFSDFFEMLFGKGFGSFGDLGSGDRASDLEFESGRGNGGAASGSDHEAEITITLEEAHAGTRKQIALQAEENGRGRPVRTVKRIDIVVPAGITDGKRLRLAGQGARGRAGSPAGDLYLVVRIAPHPRFRVKGADIEVDVPITPWEAALGAKIEVPIVGGTATLTLPAGIASGKKLRLKGKGLLAEPGKPGDLYAIIRIEVPKALTARERQLFEELARTSSFKPRRR